MTQPVFVCWEGWFSEAEIICVLTDEREAQRWKKEPPIRKGWFRDYDSTLLDPVMSPIGETP